MPHLNWRQIYIASGPSQVELQPDFQRKIDRCNSLDNALLAVEASYDHVPFIGVHRMLKRYVHFAKTRKPS